MFAPLSLVRSYSPFPDCPETLAENPEGEGISPKEPRRSPGRDGRRALSPRSKRLLPVLPQSSYTSQTSREARKNRLPSSFFPSDCLFAALLSDLKKIQSFFGNRGMSATSGAAIGRRSPAWFLLTRASFWEKIVPGLFIKITILPYRMSSIDPPLVHIPYRIVLQQSFALVIGDPRISRNCPRGRSPPCF